MEERRILESWKEISDYLQRSIKTCQRWEMELGLPIHRLDGTPSARVFAYPEELDAWKAEKLNHPEVKAKESVFVQPQRKKWVLVAAGSLILIFVIAVLGWRFFYQPSVSFPSPFTKPDLHFLPLENVAGDKTMEPWRMALPLLLEMDMIESKVVGVWPYDDLCSTLKNLQLLDAPKFSSEDLKKIVKENPTKDYYLVTGSLIKSGHDILINLFLQDSNTGEVIQSLRTVCRGESALFAAADELSNQIKLALNVPPRLVSRDIDEKASKISTNSPEAMKLYWQGFRLDIEGKVDEAIASFRKATEIDPEFAQAYYRLYLDCVSRYVCCDEPGAKDEAIRSAKKALEFADRLDIHSRRDIIRDFYLDFQKNIPMAIAEYRKLFAIWGDIFTAGQLAEVYWNQEEYDQAIVLLENSLEKMSLKEIPHWNILTRLADCYIRTGLYDKADRILEEYLADSALPVPVIDVLYLQEVCALNQGKWDEAFAFNDRIVASVPRVANSRVKCSRVPLFVAQDDYANAERELRAFIDQAKRYDKFSRNCILVGLLLTQGRVEEAMNQAEFDPETEKPVYNWAAVKKSHFFKAYLNRLSGKLPEALQEVEQACPCYGEVIRFLNPEKHIKIVSGYDNISCLRYFHLRALINLEMGRMEEFEKQAAEIKQLIEQEQYPKLMRAYYHLLGHKELRERNFDKAIDYFWKALNRLPSPYGHDEIRYEYNWTNPDIESAQYYYSLAEAYYQAGRCWSALDMYKKIPTFWEQRINSGDLYARSFYRMAKIYDLCRRKPGETKDQLKSDKALAIENYRKFLSLWKDADPIFAAEIQDARQRLTALEAE